MATTFKILGVLAPTGLMLRSRLYDPAGTAVGDCALTENPAGSGQYGGSASISGLADTTDTPYEDETRSVSTQNDAGFTASTTIRRSRGQYGFLASEIWYDIDPRLFDVAPAAGETNVDITESDVELS